MGGAQHHFPDTSWSILACLRGQNTDLRMQALTRLIQLYWKPVHTVIRRSWGKPNEEAKDLTQEFFAEIIMEGPLLERYAPEQGSFHAYLKAAITNFMRDAVKSEGRKKRGGDAKILSLDFDPNGDVALPDRSLSPEQVFDLAWKHVVFSKALQNVEQNLIGEGKAAYFEVFRRYELQPAGPQPSYREVGESMGLTETTVQNYLARVRAELRRAVIEVVADTVESRKDLSDEIRWLFQE